METRIFILGDTGLPLDRVQAEPTFAYGSNAGKSKFRCGYVTTAEGWERTRRFLSTAFLWNDVALWIALTENQKGAALQGVHFELNCYSREGERTLPSWEDIIAACSAGHQGDWPSEWINRFTLTLKEVRVSA